MNAKSHRPVPRPPRQAEFEADDTVALHHVQTGHRLGKQGKLRVIKTIVAGEPGSKALMETYGEQLVCIRHRIDPSGRVRLTTVEVVVSAARIQAKPSATVDLALPFDAHELRQRVTAAGGRWDPVRKVWRLRRATAMALGLRNRVRK